MVLKLSAGKLGHITGLPYMPVFGILEIIFFFNW